MKPLEHLTSALYLAFQALRHPETFGEIYILITPQGYEVIEDQTME